MYLDTMEILSKSVSFDRIRSWNGLAFCGCSTLCQIRVRPKEVSSHYQFAPLKVTIVIKTTTFANCQFATRTVCLEVLRESEGFNKENSKELSNLHKAI